jgi:ubiquinone/menaquinone biosynthesis C-methylase UbiE
MAQAKTYKQRFRSKAKAEKYAQRFEGGSHKRIDAREQRAVASIFSALSGCHTVVDVPCGAGRFAATIAKGRQLLETDVAHEMVVIAKRRAERNNVKAGHLQSDAAHLPFRDGAVDCLFSNRLLHHILPRDERAMFLKEFHRVSRRWVVVTFFDYRMFATVRKALKKIKRAKIRYDEQPTFEQFEAEVKAAGFCIVKVVATGPVWVAEKYLVLEKTR